MVENVGRKHAFGQIVEATLRNAPADQHAAMKKQFLQRGFGKSG